jgi:hypothetical protein
MDEPTIDSMTPRLIAWILKSMMVILSKTELQTTQNALHSNEVKTCVQTALQQQGMVTLAAGRPRHIDQIAKEVFQILKPKILTTPWFMLFTRDVQAEVKEM